ncbi:hypothetical protein QF004_001441 [Chryseobacterium sp. MDT2-18]|nr:hypothetical protein [Chryseobacterium sp. MDT2-18]
MCFLLFFLKHEMFASYKVQSRFSLYLFIFLRKNKKDAVPIGAINFCLLFFEDFLSAYKFWLRPVRIDNDLS